MLTPRRILGLCLLSAAVVGAALVWHRNTVRPTAVAEQDAPTNLAGTSSTSATATESLVTASSGGAVFSQISAWGDAAVSREFKNWTTRYLAANGTDRMALLAEGEALAKGRASEMLKLIKSNPERALAEATPYAVRKQLPESIRNQIEHPVSGEGKFSVKIYCPLPGREGLEPAPVHTVRMEGQQFTAHVFGERKNLLVTSRIGVHGVAVGQDMALSNEGARLLSGNEAADVIRAGRAAIGPVCRMCGHDAAHAGPLQLVDLGAKIFDTVCAVDVAVLNNAINQGIAHSATPGMAMSLLRESWSSGIHGSQAQFTQPKQAFGGVGGSTNPPAPPPGTLGQQRLLLIPAQYADEAAPPITQQALHAAGINIQTAFDRYSYGYEQMVTTVTPTVILPYRESVYDEGGDGVIISHAEAVASTLGYNPNSYDFVYVITTPITSANFGGISSGLSFGTGPLVHEIGHNNGLGHANFFDTTVTFGAPGGGGTDPDSLIGHPDINGPFVPGTASPVSGGAGSIVEYGDPYDTMGSGGNDFSAPMKAGLGWLSRQFVRIVPADETNRVYAFDSGTVTNGRLYALRVHRRAGNTYSGAVIGDYWLSHRQAINERFLTNGLLVQHGGSTTLLLDTTPSTYDGRRDGMITVGRTFTDPEAKVHITPIAKGGTGADTFIDVVVRRGVFPTNNAPIINSFTADDLTVAVGAPVTLVVNATDADGDPLAYHFDFSDQTVGLNSATNVHSFAAAGRYTVRVEVSDMKGGASSAILSVTVGAPNLFTISGRVTDPNGVPVQGVRVHNGIDLAPDNGTPPNAPGGHRFNYTDVNGNYTIPNIAPGTFNVGAFKYRLRSTPENFNGSVVVATADVSGVDFIVAPLPIVSVSVASSAAEPGTPGAFRVSRVGGVLTNALDVRIVVTTPDSAGFTPAASTLTDVTISANQTFTDVVITPVDNAVGDGGRRVRLTAVMQTNLIFTIPFLTNGVFIDVLRTNSFPGWEQRPRPSDNVLTWYLTDPNYVLDNAEAMMVITDNDPPSIPTVAAAAANLGVTEGSRNVGTFALTRSNGRITTNLTVNFSLTGGATNGIDYLSVPTTVTFLAGEATAFVPIVPINNYFVESNRPVNLNVLAGPGYTPGGNATLTIVDDDLPNLGVFASDPFAGRTGGNTGTFRITRAGDLTRDVLVNYLVTGTAVAGSDYTVLSGSVTIPAGQFAANVTVTPGATASTPGPKTVILVLSDSPAYNIISEGRALVKISDNVPTVTVAATGPATEAGAVGVFTITRTGATTSALNVFYVVGGSANANTDYSGIGTNVVIPIGAASVTLSVDAIDDAFREFTATGQNNLRLNEHEDVQIHLVPDDAYDVGGADRASLTITDNDNGVLVPGISFLTQGTVVREDAGTVSIPVRIGGNPTNDLSQPLIVNWALTGGTGIRNTNYSITFTNGTFQFVSNMVPTMGFYEFTDQIQFLQFNTIDDGVVTGDRTVIFNLSYFTGFVLVGTNLVPLPTNYVLGDFRTHTVTIKDADTATVSVVAIQRFAFENGSAPGVFRFSRTGSIVAPVTVNVLYEGTAASGADYIALPSTVTIPAGTNIVDVQVVPFDDLAQEQAETVLVRMAQTPGVKVSGGGNATVVIVDNDGTIQFTAAQYSVNEGATNAVIDVLRTGNTNGLSTVEYTIDSGTALNSIDFDGTNGLVTFAPGEALQQIVIPLFDDLAVELPETFSLTLTNATGGAPLGGQRNAVVTIVDNDIAFEFATNAFRAYENATNALITVARRGVTNGAVNVQLVTADGSATAGADYNAITNTVSFVAGQVTTNVLVPLLNDVAVEGDETVLLTLLNPSAGTTLEAVSNSVLTIVEDETRLEFVSGTNSVIEYAGFVPVEIRRLGGTRHPLTVGFRAISGTASNTLDFLLATGTVTFAGDTNIVLTNGSGQTVFQPGQSSRFISVPIFDDALGEGDEAFSLFLTNLTGPSGQLAGTFALGAQSNTVVTITDDEQPGFVDFAYRPIVGLGGGATVGGPTTTIDGVVRNTVTGTGLPGVTVNVAGSTDISDLTGAYTLTNIPIGLVQLDATAAGFFDFSSSYTLANQPTNVVNFSMSPVITGTNTVRLVLSWGANPGDLDSYLDTPPIFGTNYQVSFFNRGDLALPPFAALDVDDVDGFGPETITITNTFPGTYSYFINRFSGAGTIASSGAQVQVYTDAGLVATVNVPTNGGSGDFWHVLQLDGVTRGLTVINTIGNSAPVVISNLPPSIIVQPVTTTVDAGSPATLSVVASGSPPLGYQWRRGAAPIAGATNTLLTFANTTLADAGSYSVIVTNAFGAVTSSVAALNINVACGTGINGGLVFALALDTNQNKVVLGGAFTTVDGLSLRRIARLNPNGTVDGSFNPGAGANSNVTALAVQTDGKVLLGGDFTNVDGSNRVRIARLNVDGNIDGTFNALTGPNGVIRAFAVQPDGNILVAGEFTSFAGDTNAAFLARLSTNGTLDTSFNARLNGAVHALALQPDGSILAGGCFTTVGGIGRNRIARLNSGGTNDALFNPGLGADAVVRSIGLQPDGKILIGGAFPNYDGAFVGFIARLNAEGTRDTGFATGMGADAPVNAVVVAPKGKVYVAGAFSVFNGLARRGFTRLLGTGAHDGIYDPGSGANGPVFAALAQADSALVIGGNFTQVRDLPRTGLARVHGDEKSVLAEVEFTSANFVVQENAGPAVITISRTGNTNSAMSLGVLATDLSAVSGTDYTGGLFAANFAPNQATATVNIPIADNGAVNSNRAFALVFTNVPLTVRLSGITNSLVTIEDNESGFRLSSSNYTVMEGATVTVIIERIGRTNNTGSINILTTDITAVSGVDYNGFTNTLTFPPGLGTMTIAIAAIEDFTLDPARTATITLANATNSIIDVPGSATLTIIDFMPVPGGPVLTFDPGAGANDFVRVVASQPDGNVLIGGAFTQFGGTNRNHLARLNTNAVLDAGYNAGVGVDGLVSSIAILPNGQAAIGGAFTNVGGGIFNRLARLNANGGPDLSFSPPFTLDASLNALAADANGKLMLGGAFSLPTPGIARLLANSSVDAGLSVGSGANGPVHAVAADAEGRIYLGGAFTAYNGSNVLRVARLGSNGVVDTAFSVQLTNGIVFALVAQPDGRVLIGGEFTNVAGVARNRIARLNTDGSLDTTFDPGVGANGVIYTLALQSNGRLLAGGDFTTFGGTNAGRFVRVEANGAVDSAFLTGAGANNTVYSIAVTPDGRIVLAGDFATFNGLNRRGVAMVYGDEPRVEIFSREPLPGGTGYTLMVNTVPGAVYALDSTEDLVAWTARATNVAFGTSLKFTDAVMPPAYRFYRVRLLTP